MQQSLTTQGTQVRSMQRKAITRVTQALSFRRLGTLGYHALPVVRDAVVQIAVALWHRIVNQPRSSTLRQTPSIRIFSQPRALLRLPSTLSKATIQHSYLRRGSDPNVCGLFPQKTTLSDCVLFTIPFIDLSLLVLTMILSSVKDMPTMLNPKYSFSTDDLLLNFDLTSIKNIRLPSCRFFMVAGSKMFKDSLESLHPTRPITLRLTDQISIYIRDKDGSLVI